MFVACEHRVLLNNGVYRYVKLNTRVACAMVRRGALLTADSIGVRVAVCDSPLDWAWASPVASETALPPLPVPPLNATLDAYVSSVAPHLSAAALRETSARAARFGAEGGLGRQLQARLVERQLAKQKEGTSWIAEWWDDLAYMQWRGSLPFTVSYFIALRDDPQRVTQLERAAGLAVEMARTCLSVQSGAMPRESFGRGAKAAPLCSNAFKFLFNSARLPRPHSDATRCFDPSDVRCAVIAISRKGQIFTLSMLRDATAAAPLCASNLLSAAEVEVRLAAVVRAAGSVAAPSLGPLSAMDRDEWCQSRSAMLRVGANAAAFDSIDRSMFLLCLDDTAPVAQTDVNYNSLLDPASCANRYWDKTVRAQRSIYCAHARAHARARARRSSYSCTRASPSRFVLHGTRLQKTKPKMSWWWTSSSTHSHHHAPTTQCYLALCSP